MFSLDEFKKSRLYQEEEEAMLQMFGALWRRGFSVEDIADLVQLDVVRVRLVVHIPQEIRG